MTWSIKPALLPILLLAGCAALHGERPLITAREGTLKEGTYNNDATPPWVLTVKDGKASITDPKGKVVWKVGRDGAPPRDYESDSTWLELDRSGTLILWENISNIYSSDRFKKERWRRPGTGGGTRALFFQNDGQLRYAEK
jgi:hypothetical protein